MERFRCGDLIPGCDAEFSGGEPEIVAAMDDHVRAEHGLPELPPELERAIRSAMTAG
jgi:predicted small metal-binding protein